MTNRDYFKGKRIAVIGIGPHGEMISDIKFLIKMGAFVSVYDMRSESRLKSEISFLREAGLASYVCGSVPADDLLDMDLIILSHEYPRTSSFLIPATKANIPIEYPESLFFRMAPPITVIGVMGSCGKSTVLSMLEPMLETVVEEGEQGLCVIDPDTAGGIIAHLKKIKSGDVVLARIIEPMMKELHALRISPHVAVFTTVPPKGSYDKSPFEIVTYQTYNNFIVASDEVIDATHAMGFQPKAKMLRTKASILPELWEFSGRGAHDRDNASLAIQVAKLFKVSDEVIQGVIESWKPLRGRIELVKKVRQVEFYNDTASVTPYSTQVALKELGKNLVLIYGGIDNGNDHKTVYAMLPQHVKTLILLPGSGTMKERKTLSDMGGVEAGQTFEVCAVASIEEAVTRAMEKSVKGGRVLFSPGFGAGGLDQSRKERGEKFVRAVRGLK